MIGATCDEIEAQYKAAHQSMSARVNELAAANVIVDDGQRRYTRRKRKAAVYVLAPGITFETGLAKYLAWTKSGKRLPSKSKRARSAEMAVMQAAREYADAAMNKGGIDASHALIKLGQVSLRELGQVVRH